MNRSSIYKILGRYLRNISYYNEKKIAIIIAKILINYYAKLFENNIKINYEHLYPFFSEEQKRKYINWKVYTFCVLKNYLIEQMEIMKVPYISSKEFKKYIPNMNVNSAKKVFDEGAILVIPHISGWEIAGIVVGFIFNKRLMTVAESKNINKETYKFYEYIRSISGMKVLPVETSQKEMIKHLKQNNILIIAGDRDILKTGWEIEFFNERAKLPSGALSLSYITGKKIVVYTIYRTDEGDLKANFIGNLDVNGDKNKLKKYFLREYAMLLEKSILAYPEGWFVFYPVWEQ